jgi:hypothetical protein
LQLPRTGPAAEHNFLPEGLDPRQAKLHTAQERHVMSTKVGINGFGRIGRNIFRTALSNPELDFVAINDLTTSATLAHLLKYDSILGNLQQPIEHGTDYISVAGKKIRVFAERDPSKLDWASVGAQVVVESTGFFTDATKAAAHLGSSVKKVIISAPATNEDLTVVLGVNDQLYDPLIIMSFQMHLVRRTVWHLSLKSSTTPLASSQAS